MKSLTDSNFRCWASVVRRQPRTSAELLSWLTGPLKEFFPHRGLILTHGELVAGEMNITHMLTTGHEERYVCQLARKFELDCRGSLRWWFAERRPFYIDPGAPPHYASKFELEEIHAFSLQNVAAHGVLNVRANAGTYFSFSGIEGPLSNWHLEALELMTPVLNERFIAYCACSSNNANEKTACLSFRQKEIVRHVATGLDDKQIGRALGVSEKTIRNHLVDVYAQMGVHKRTQLMMILK
ncbi:LuxR C-terminal-related transcriptional regulator [Variovorax sp. H27-G14]|uniref:helix-turn-helix transcriptional regulator n=1 Tax=Variovorax sp. H27-G14 TaxID=3111914 RepID=UPI0038FC5057